MQPHEAAYWAIIAICLVLLGALLTVGVVGLAERAAVLVAIASILLTVAWRGRGNQ